MVKDLADLAFLGERSVRDKDRGEAVDFEGEERVKEEALFAGEKHLALSLFSVQ